MRYPGHDAHRAVVEALVREAPALVFNTGDLTDVGSEESNWQRYFEITAPLGAIAPVVPALGNHDADRRGVGAADRLVAVRRAHAGAAGLDLARSRRRALRDPRHQRDAQPARSATGCATIWRARAPPPRARHLRLLPRGALVARAHGDSHRMVRDYAPLLAAATSTCCSPATTTSTSAASA